MCRQTVDSTLLLPVASIDLEILLPSIYNRKLIIKRYTLPKHKGYINKAQWFIWKKMWMIQCHRKKQQQKERGNLMAFNSKTDLGQMILESVAGDVFKSTIVPKGSCLWIS